MSADDWTKDSTPAVPGWYAVLVCWDAQEGVFPMALQWDGGWPRGYPATWFAGPFASEDEATDWAYEHDPGG